MQFQIPGNNLIRGVILAVMVILLAFKGNPVLAGGLYIGEFGQPSMGASNAGAGVLAQDASTAFFNPAGIMMLKNKQWMATALGVYSSVEFEQSAGTTVGANGSAVPGSGSNGGDAGSVAGGGAFFLANPVGERWGYGLSVVSISGAVLNYADPANFVGRYWAQNVDLLTLNITPAFAWRLSDEFSVAVGLPIMVGRLDMDVAIPGPLATDTDGLAQIEDGNDVSVTFTVSALWEINERTRLGLVYLDENDLSFDSDLTITLPGGGPTLSDISTDVELPFVKTLRLSGSRELNEKVTLLGTVAWEDWSTFEDVIISTSAGGAALPRNWDDTLHYALGVRVRTNGAWTWYSGAAYDTDPTRASDRTADMPMDRQIRLSFGATKEKSDEFEWGYAITYADYGDGEISNGGTRPISGAPWTVVGEYGTNRIIFAGLNFNWK